MWEPPNTINHPSQNHHFNRWYVCLPHMVSDLDALNQWAGDGFEAGVLFNQRNS